MPVRLIPYFLLVGLVGCTTNQPTVLPIGRPPAGGPVSESTTATAEFDTVFSVNPGGGQIKEYRAPDPVVSQYVIKERRRYVVRRYSNWNFTFVRTFEPGAQPVVTASVLVETFWNDIDPAGSGRPMSRRGYTISFMRGDEVIWVHDPAKFSGDRKRCWKPNSRPGTVTFTRFKVPSPTFEATDRIRVLVKNEQFLPCEWPPRRPPPPPAVRRVGR